MQHILYPVPLCYTNTSLKREKALWIFESPCLFGIFVSYVCLSECLMFIFSAPADASTEDAAAHATGNGVASEVGRLHAHLHSMCCDM